MDVFPLILDAKFSKKLVSHGIQALKENFDFDKNSKIVLFMGGGDGLQKGNVILKKFQL